MDPNNAIKLLETSPLFAVLTPEELAMLNRDGTVQTYGKHAVLYRPGQTSDRLYFILKGTVKVTVHAERKDIIKYIVRPGGLLGESCLAGEETRRDFVYSMDDQLEFMEFPATAVLSVMKSNFAFAQSLLHLIGERLRYTESQLENVVLKDSKSRIVDFLRRMGLEQGSRVGYETLVRHNMTHQDIADMTGTSRQMVTAVLNQLKRSNLLHFNRKKILFRDLNALPVSLN